MKLYGVELGSRLLLGTSQYPSPAILGAAVRASGCEIVTVSLRRGGLLMAVLALPLTIPVLIFGVSAASAASGGFAPFLTPFAVLAAISLFTMAAAPFAAAAAIRLTRE